MATQKIKTKNKVSINNVGEYYIAREILSFRHDLKNDKTNPIYYEYAYEIVDVTGTDPEGNETTMQVENVVKVFPQSTQIYTNEEVNYFFGLDENGVSSIEELQELIRDALLADTVQQNRYGTVEWEIYN